MHGVLFVLIAVTVKMFYADSTWKLCGWTFLAMILSAICAGSNFVTALQGILCLGSALVLMLVYKRKAGFYCILPLIIYSIGFYISISAPGNEIRGSHFQGYGAIESILYSFVSAFKNFWELTGFRFFVVLALFLLMYN